MSHDLLHHFVGVANQQRAVRTSLGVETRTGDGRPSALLRDAGDGTGVAGKEGVSGLLCSGRDIAERVHPDFESIGRVTGLTAGLPVEIDEGTEAPRFPPNDGDHQRKSELARTSERSRGPTNPQPYRQG